MTAMDSTLTPTDRPPSTDAWGPGITMAVLVHVALIIALAFGVSWRSSEPAGIEAELWAAIPQAAAPKVEAPPKLEPPPQPKPEPPPAPKVVEPPQPTEAEIAIEKAKQEKLKREQEEERQRRERERESAELKKQQAAEREAQRKREEEENRLAKERAADEQRLAKQREENLNKMLAQAGGTGGTGSAARSAGHSSGYAGRIVARVKPNILFGDEVAGNPMALVEVRAAPDGTITSRRLVKSSGVRAWDDAVLRAIDRTETLPRDVDGRVPPTIEIEFRPNS